MYSYKVMLDFIVSMAGADLTPGQKPPMNPKEIQENYPHIHVELRMDDGLGNRAYHVETVVEAESSEGLADALQLFFAHLPGFKVTDGSVNREPESASDARDKAATDAQPASLAERQAAAAESGPTGPFRVQCLFSSALPFERLQALFTEHVAGGNLVSNANRHSEYVAFVDFEAVSAEGLEDAARTLLLRAFDAETEEWGVNFCPITTRVL